MANVYDMIDTWNDGATTFTAIKMDVTDTASGASSLLMDLQVGGVSKFSVSKVGGVVATSGGGSGTGYQVGNWNMDINGAANLVFRYNGMRLIQYSGPNSSFNAASFGLGNPDAPDVKLTRDAAGTLAQRNGTNAQTLNLYNTYTDASNYEQARMGWTANAYQIKPEAAGTGTVRVLHISGLPTSDPGTGILWNDAGTVKVGA